MRPFLVLCCLIWFAQPLAAKTLDQTAIFAGAPSQRLFFDGFDPALGTLTQVSLSFDMTTNVQLITTAGLPMPIPGSGYVRMDLAPVPVSGSPAPFGPGLDNPARVTIPVEGLQTPYATNRIVTWSLSLVLDATTDLVGTAAPSLLATGITTFDGGRSSSRLDDFVLNTPERRAAPGLGFDLTLVGQTDGQVTAAVFPTILSGTARLGYSYVPAAVPLPATGGLLVLPLIGLACAARRRRRKLDLCAPVA